MFSTTTGKWVPVENSTPDSLQRFSMDPGKRAAMENEAPNKDSRRVPGAFEHCVKTLGEILLSNVNVADVPEVNGGCVSVVAQVVFQTGEVVVLCI